ncbi:MAG: XRE family transcriptional regulator [Aestuariivita sp.]|nr:XRE family transcriptional regulator [Aestuariivita sp.]
MTAKLKLFNQEKLKLARTRRHLTKRKLAERAEVSALTLTRLEQGKNQPDATTAKRLACVLKYPVEFFFGDELEVITPNTVSFRGFTRMTAKERDAAVAAGSLGLYLSRWVEERFVLPENQLLDLSHETDPEMAAEYLRQHWSLGNRPIGHMIQMLETYGVRVFSLSENTASVDAFSFWYDNTPFIFLNNFKTAEHSVFDAAHELGHLVMHKRSNLRDSKSVEREANHFASAFLMPRDDILTRVSPLINVSTVLDSKTRWRVSALAFTYRLRKLNLISEWQYKSICMKLGKLGYRSGEPGGIDPEESAIWPKVFSQFWSEKVTKQEIAEELCLPIDELNGLVWGISKPKADAASQSANRLRLIENSE